MAQDEEIASHYSGEQLLPAIEAGLAALGSSPATATIDELGPVDEFHIGGRPATTELCEQLEVNADSEVLDVGSGIGGTARFISATFGCGVTGIDLTPEYVDVARTLSEWTGLSHKLRFELGSALDMPFPADSFDLATQLHVGMNIEDKVSLCAEVFRVLRPGGRFAVYDIMRHTEGDHGFPVPWASDASMSFVDSPDAYRRALEAAGFVIASQRDRRQFALDAFETQRRQVAELGGPPPLGLNLIIGSDTPVKIGNLLAALEAGVLAPVEMIAEKQP
jgi:ubiquinone/menaquinone biosynthesis C-methylase UbiE